MNKLSLKEKKIAFRKKISQKLKDFGTENLKFASNKASKILFSSQVFKRAEKILLYAPFFKTEIDLFGSLVNFVEQFKKKKFYLPKVLKRPKEKIICAFNSLENLEFKQSSLKAGEYKNLELKDSIDLFDFSLFELVLIPGLSFDKSGIRLGRGLGYYDRLISACSSNKQKAVLVGVCLESFFLKSLSSKKNTIKELI